MSLGIPQRRLGLICAMLAVAAIIGLIVAAAQPITVRSFVLYARPMTPILGIDPPQRLCEGPITSSHPFDVVEIWGAALAHHRAHVDILVQDTQGHAVLSAGRVTVTDAAGLYTAQLTRPVSSAQPVRVCVSATSDHYIALGTNPVDPGVVLAGHPGLQFSLNLADNRPSLLGTLSRAFSRAALWRPAWVGAWTFWVLAAGVLAAFGAAIVAVMRAVQEDEEVPADLSGTGASGRSEPSEDRAQPVAE